MKRKTFLALAASAMLAVLAGLSACSNFDDPVLSQDDTMETAYFAPPKSLYDASMGDVLGDDKKAYTVNSSQLLPWNVTPIGMLAAIERSTTKNCLVGLIIALDDEPEEMDWETAKGPNGAAAHTPVLDGYAWRLPSIGDWANMLSYRYSEYYSDRLKYHLTNIGGTTMEGYYWSTREVNEYEVETPFFNNDKKLTVRLESFISHSKESLCKVRACFNIDLRYDISPEEFVLSDSILSLTASSHSKSFTVTRPSSGKVTATCSDPKVVSVTVTDATSETATVNVTAISDGTATITVKCDATFADNAYTANDKTVSVTATGIEHETLVELKAWVTAGHTANTSYLCTRL